MFHYGSEATCQTKGVCSVCGYEYYGEHNVAVPDYVYIDDMKCGSYCATEGCDHLSEWSYHTGGTSDCQHKAICEICHHEYGKLGEHSLDMQYTSVSADGHAHKCTVDGCNEHDELVPHIDDNGDNKCDICGYAMPAHDPDTPDQPDNPDNPGTNPPTDDPPSDDEGGLGTGAIVGIVVGSVAVVGIGGFALFWFVIKKKSFADLIAVFKK